MDENEWKEIQALLKRTIDQLNNFRHTEGEALESDLKKRIKSIQDTLPQVEVFEAERKKKVVARLENAFTEFVNNETVTKIDLRRFCTI